MLNEFKKFAMKGNVVDMAVGVIIGGAFGKIVSSLVNDIIMPPIGYLTGGVDFRELTIVMQQAINGAEEVTINYGIFLNNILDFLIIAFSIFVVIKQINRIKSEEKPKEERKQTKEEELLVEIRDLLKKDM